jgi:hypothetical protein
MFYTGVSCQLNFYLYNINNIVIIIIYEYQVYL